MKVNTFKQEIAELSPAELHDKLLQLRRQLFSLKLNATTAHIKDYSLFKKLRRDIARVVTRLQHAQKEGA